MDDPAGLGWRLDVQAELLGKMLERLTELRVILQELADREPGPDQHVHWLPTDDGRAYRQVSTGPKLP